MGRRGVVGVFVVAATLALAACGGNADPEVTVGPDGDRQAHGLQVGAGARVPVSLTDATASESVVAASWRAGFAMLQASDEPAGTVVSPASLVIALSMLAEGASGDSAATLDEVLGATGDERTDAVNALTATLERFAGDPALVRAKALPETPMVHVANQVVVDDDQTIAGPYLDRLMSAYGAGVLVTDLSSSAGRKDLDAWVNKHTGGLVKESAIEPDRYLVLVLQNAIALAAAWQTPFGAGETSDDTFALASGEEVTVRMMHGDARWAHAERDGWRALRLPYTTDLHADVILPPEGSPEAADPATAPPGLVAALAAGLDDAAAGDAVISMPKLDLTSRVDLRSVLEALGLGHLLSPDTAGLDGLLVDPPGPPWVQQAVQQAVLQVDEAGTRAAAVTELGIDAGAAPAADPFELVLDRPYLFVVRDGTTGLPLFLAAVLDPRG